MSILDRTISEALAWSPDAELLERHAVDMPFRYILSWWGGERRKPLIHSGAVGRDERCVLLAGKGGSGKSTTSLFCVEQGMRFLSDDFLVVDPTGDRPTAHSLYSTAKLWRSDEFVERLMGSVAEDTPAAEKGTAYMWERRPDVIQTSAQAVAILLPRVVGGRSMLQPASGADALKAIVPSTFLVFPRSSTEVMSAISGFIKRLPTYHLLLGDDVDRIPVLVDSVLERHGA